jgi:hypothetical protein
VDSFARERDFCMSGRRFFKRGSSGFSIMELVFGFLIVAILLGMTISNLKFSVEKEGPRGLAFTIASDLRAARAEAQRSGKMVAVCFPSEGRTNSLSRSAVVRKGAQRGHVSKILSFGDEYDATFFLGSWPGSAVDSSHDLPISWSISTNDAMVVYFRPDGTAFSNEIPEIGGNYPLVVASSFNGSLNGPTGTLSHAKNPHTVWVSASGSVTVDENKLPSGTLPPGESNLAIAEFDLSGEPSPTAPVILYTKFLPEKVEGLDTANVGQNFVSVHPNQKEGGYLEYGLATIEIKAKDQDGGPLTYTLEAEASAGDSGKFTVTNQEGQMRYVFDETENDHVWQSVISWRPPPGSPPDLEYELTVLINDPDGNSIEVSSAAGLLPKVTSLPPARLVMSTDDNELYLANLDGSNEIQITKNGAESLPFFSADGSRVFSFYDHSDGSGKRELRVRTANGTTSYDQLAVFDNVGTTVRFDPTFTFAALVIADGTDYFPYLYVWSETVDDGAGGTTIEWYSRAEVSEPAKYKILMVNLMSSDPPVLIASDVSSVGAFRWSGPENRFTFGYGSRVGKDPGPLGGPFTGVPSPGFKAADEYSFHKLEGHPPVKQPAAAFPGKAVDRSYNPADPGWYMEISSGTLYVKHSDGTSHVISSAGAFENDPENRKTPAWSANGEFVSFIENPGASGKLVCLKVLNSDLQWLGSPATTTTISGNLSSAQVSPEGEWIYYLRGNQLFRVESGGSAGVNISSRISGSLSGYVISP